MALLTTSLTIPASASEVTSFVPPVNGVVSQRFQAPQVDWGPGHRGIDFAAEAGTAVRAAGPGTVVFAGEVAGFPAVTIDHGNGLETTYSILSRISVAEGDRVEAGRWIGEVGEAHPGIRKWSPLRGEGRGRIRRSREPSRTDRCRRRDPSRAARMGTAGCSRRSTRYRSRVRSPGRLSASRSRRWSAHRYLPTTTLLSPSPVSAAIRAAACRRTCTSMDRSGSDTRRAKTYRFSYRGAGGPGLHEPYDSTDTYGDLVTAARRLGDARASRGCPAPRNEHRSDRALPGRHRRSLLSRARSRPRSAPRVEHLVTFATPHGGAPGAGLVPALDERAWGRLLVDGLSELVGERWSHPGPKVGCRRTTGAGIGTHGTARDGADRATARGCSLSRSRTTR